MKDALDTLVHDLNNPLVYVTLGLELIERELSRMQASTPTAEDWERLRALLKDAAQGAERVRELLREIAQRRGGQEDE